MPKIEDKKKPAMRIPPLGFPVTMPVMSAPVGSYANPSPTPSKPTVYHSEKAKDRLGIHVTTQTVLTL